MRRPDPPDLFHDLQQNDTGTIIINVLIFIKLNTWKTIYDD